jgi:membrane protease YdiL (CAAX protease family)
MKIKKILKVIYFIVVIQLLRIALKNVLFLLITPSLLINNIFNIIYMLIITIAFMYEIKKKRPLKKIPKRYYLYATLIIIMNFISLFIGKKFTNEAYLFFLLNIIIMPIYEELLFREYIWNDLKKDYNSTALIIITACLSALWYLGYIDTLIMQMIFNNLELNFTRILIEIGIGFMYGLILGLSKIKFKNNYACILIHSVLNSMKVLL